MTAVILGFISRYWVHLLVIASLAAGVNLIYKAGVADERERWENKAYQATIETQKAAGKFTAGLISDHQVNQNDSNVKIEQLEADLISADNAAIGLREQIKSYAAKQRQCAINSSRDSSNRKSAEEAIGVLSKLLSESDQRAGVYADYADRLEISRDSCEKSYVDLKKRIDGFGVKK